MESGPKLMSKPDSLSKKYKIIQNINLSSNIRYKLGGLKSPQIRHWLMSALRGKADIIRHHCKRENGPNSFC